MPTKKSPRKKGGKNATKQILQWSGAKLTIVTDNPDPGDQVPIKKEAVNHPSHYGGKDNPYEVIKVLEAFPRIINNGHLFNATKYLLRAGEKVEPGMTAIEAEIQDLEKNIWYSNRRISALKKLLLEQE